MNQRHGGKVNPQEVGGERVGKGLSMIKAPRAPQIEFLIASISLVSFFECLAIVDYTYLYNTD